MFIWRRHITWTEIVILCGWGLLAANTPIGRVPGEWLTALSTQISHWF